MRAILIPGFWCAIVFASEPSRATDPASILSAEEQAAFAGENRDAWREAADDLSRSQLIELTQHSDAAVRTRAIEALGLRSGELIELFVTGLRDPDPHVQAAAAFALSRYGLYRRESIGQFYSSAAGGSVATAAFQDLVGLLDHADPHVRGAAAYALGSISPRSLPDLIALLDDESEYVRYVVTDCIGNFGVLGKDALPALLECLHDPSSRIRMSAARSIGALGAEARTAIPALIEYLEQYDGDYVLDGQYPGAIALEPIAGSTAETCALLSTGELQQVIADLRNAAGVLPRFDGISTRAVRESLVVIEAELAER